MAEEDEYSIKPSGILYKQSKKGEIHPPKAYGREAPFPDIKPPSLPKRESFAVEERPAFSGGGGKMGRAEILAGAAFVLALVSLVLNMMSIAGIGVGQKAELAAIAADLRSIQQKDVVLSAPVQTNVQLDEEIALNEVFPPNFRIPVTFNLKLPEKVTAISTTGQVAEFTFGQTVPISQDIFVDTAGGAGTGIRIKKEIPVSTTVMASVKVKDMYGTELDDIISRLERLGG